MEKDWEGGGRKLEGEGQTGEKGMQEKDIRRIGNSRFTRKKNSIRRKKDQRSSIKESQLEGEQESRRREKKTEGG